MASAQGHVDPVRGEEVLGPLREAALIDLDVATHAVEDEELVVVRYLSVRAEQQLLDQDAARDVSVDPSAQPGDR
jgi:hypothetical protein